MQYEADLLITYLYQFVLSSRAEGMSVSVGTLSRPISQTLWMSAATARQPKSTVNVVEADFKTSCSLTVCPFIVQIASESRNESIGALIGMDADLLVWMLIYRR